MILVVTDKHNVGKSTVARRLCRHGLRLIDADRLGHKLLREKRIKARVVKAFGPNILLHGRVCGTRIAEDRNLYYITPPQV